MSMVFAVLSATACPTRTLPLSLRSKEGGTTAAHSAWQWLCQARPMMLWGAVEVPLSSREQGEGAGAAFSPRRIVR